MEKLIEYGLQKDMVFLVLFVFAIGGLAWLVRWVLRTNDDREKRYIEREERYIGVIENQAQKFSIVEGIQNSVDRIERKLGL